MPDAPEVLRYAAFTDDPAGGNPAGVVLDASGLDDAAMQAIAAEIGYSETAFVTGRDASGDLHVRYFSPEAEVPFCGHATIATGVAWGQGAEPAPVPVLVKYAYAFEQATRHRVAPRFLATVTP